MGLHKKLLSEEGQQALAAFKVVCVQYLPELCGASHCQLHVERCGIVHADQRAVMSASVSALIVIHRSSCN